MNFSQQLKANGIERRGSRTRGFRYRYVDTRRTIRSAEILARIESLKIPPAWDFARRVEEHMKGMVSPGTLFEELGFNYIGPIDGHDLPNLIHTIRNMRELVRKGVRPETAAGGDPGSVSP